MLVSKDILLVTNDAATSRAVAAAFEARDDVPIASATDLSEAERRLERAASALVLVDIDADPLGLLERLVGVMKKAAGSRFVVVCSEFRSDVVLEAMQVGARHCLLKGSILDELPRVYQRMLQDLDGGDGSHGKVVTVLSASGGCGGTTVAINLAEELHQRAEGRVLLIDLDQYYGAVGTYLGLSSDYGVVDVLRHNGAVDAQLIGSTACEYSHDMHVLLSPASVDFVHPAALPVENLEHTLEVCKRSYPYTVIDAPRAPIGLAEVLVDASAYTLVLFELNVVDVRTARSLITALTDRGVAPERILAVANRYHKRRSMLSLADASEALGMHARPLSNDYEGSSRSLNFGQTLAKAAPRSAFRKDVRDLAAFIASETPVHAH